MLVKINNHLEVFDSRSNGEHDPLIQLWELVGSSPSRNFHFHPQLNWQQKDNTRIRLLTSMNCVYNT